MWVTITRMLIFDLFVANKSHLHFLRNNNKMVSPTWHISILNIPVHLAFENPCLRRWRWLQFHCAETMLPGRIKTALKQQGLAREERHHSEVPKGRSPSQRSQGRLFPTLLHVCASSPSSWLQTHSTSLCSAGGGETYEHTHKVAESPFPSVNTQMKSIFV